MQEDETDYPAFTPETVKICDVEISVTASAGIFPEGAVLSVDTVTDEEREKADEAIEEVRDGNRNVASSYTYDIKVLAADGMTELEPAEDSKVKVTFSIAEAADENLETDVYHLTEDSETGELTAEKLDILNNEFDEDAIISEETSDDSVMSDKSAAALFLEIILQR